MNDKTTLRDIFMMAVIGMIFHQINAIVNYVQLRRQDAGKEPKKRHRAVEFIIEKLMMLSYMMELPYMFTFGIIDHLQIDRLAKMVADRVDEIVQLKNKIEKMEKHIEDCHAYQKSLYDCAVENADPQKVRFVKCHTFSSFCDLQRIEALSADEDY